MSSSNQNKLAVVAIAVPLLLRVVYRQFTRIRNEPGRIAIVTGAAGGVGKETVLLLVNQGWKVYACDVNEAGLTAAEFPSASVTPIAFDVRNDAQCQSLLEKVQTETGGKLDALLNIAGVVQSGPVLGSPVDKARFIYDINTFGPWRLCELFTPLLLRGRFGGSIINLASISGKLAWPWSGSYSSSKAALIAFSDGLRREALANSLPLRVSVVAPGPISTPMIAQVPQMLRAWADANPKSPFAGGCAASADLQLGLQNLGFSQDSVSVTARDVAETCVDLLDSKYPAAFTLVMTLPFSFLYKLCYYLPTCLGDRLLIRM